MFAGDCEKPQHDNYEPERVAYILLKTKIKRELVKKRKKVKRYGFKWANEIFFAERNEMHKDPNDAQNGDKQVETIATTLPVAERTERARLHDRFQQEQERENRRECCQQLRLCLVDIPLNKNKQLHLKSLKQQTKKRGYLTYRNREESAVEKDEKGGEAFEELVLGDVEHEGTKSRVLRPRWYVQRLR